LRSIWLAGIGEATNGIAYTDPGRGVHRHDGVYPTRNGTLMTLAGADFRRSFLKIHASTSVNQRFISVPLPASHQQQPVLDAPEPG